jgi:hypothetical protein
VVISKAASRGTEDARLGSWDKSRLAGPGGVLMREVLDTGRFEMSGLMVRPERYLKALVRRHFPTPSKLAIPHLRLLKAYFSLQVTAVVMLINRWVILKL